MNEFNPRRENDYLYALQKEDQADPVFRATLSQTAGVNPDQYAAKKRVAAYLGYPTAVVENQPYLEKQAKILQVEDATRNTPELRRRYTDQDFARLAHDDSGALAQITTAVQDYVGSFAGGGVNDVGMRMSGIGRLLDMGQRRGIEAFSSVFLPEPKRGPMGMEPQKPTAESLIGPSVGKDWQAVGKQVKDYAQNDLMVSPERRTFGHEVASGLGQIGAQGATLFATGGFGSGLSLFATGTDAVGDKTDKMNASQGAKDVAMLGGGVVTAATEAIGLHSVFGKLAVPLTNKFLAAASRVGMAAAGEGSSEWAENVLHDALIQTLVDPSHKIDLGGAAGDAGVAATVGGIARTMVESALHIKTRGNRQTEKAQSAADAGQKLQELFALADSSKTKGRDAETFHGYLNSLFQDGKAVHIEADVLESALGANLQTIIDAVPSIKSQYSEARATGGMLEIPVSELAAFIPGDVAQSLVPLLRESPDAMNLQEAEHFYQNGNQEMESQIDGELTPQQRIADAILQKFDGTDKYSPSERALYADFMSRYFDATSKQLGMEPEAFFKSIEPGLIQDRRVIDSQGNMTEETPGVVTQDLDQPRGYYDPGARVIALMKRADKSTFIHESAHYFLEMHMDLFSHESASPQLKNDVQTLMKWFGVEDLAAWKALPKAEQVKHHESFARGWEAYTMEGKAPSMELAGVFKRFSQWLTKLYGKATSLNVELSDDVREVMGRMVATQEQISHMEEMRGYEAMFEGAQEIGMSENEWNEYQTSVGDAPLDAMDKLQRKSLKDMQWLRKTREGVVNKLSKAAKARKDEIQAEVATEVNDAPVYRAWRDLEREATQDGHRVKLRAEDVKGSKVPGKMVAKDGTHPDVVAEAYGIESGDKLVKMLATLEHPDKVIKRETEARMFEEYAELNSREAIERAADLAVHNEFRARVIEREMNALDRAIGSKSLQLRAIRAYAEQTISGKQVKAIKPGIYTAAEARANREAKAAWKKGDTQTAAAKKRDSAIQFELGKTALQALDEVDAIVAEVKRLGKHGSEGLRKNIAPEYRVQIDALLERYDLRKGTTLKDIDKRKSLAEWAVQQREEFGIEPDIDLALLDDSKLVSYKELTLNELRNLRDTVKIIRQLGELKDRLLTVKDNRNFDAVVSDVAASIVANGGKAKPLELEGSEGVKPWLEGVMANHRKIASLVRQMDGGKDGGPMWSVFVRGMNAAGTKEESLSEKATLDMMEIMKPLGDLSKKVFIPEINASLSVAGRMSIALNWGNTTNRQRVMQGDKWTAGQVEAILKTLSKTELQTVNRIWAMLDGYWPQVEAKALRVDGVAPEKVQPEPFTAVSSDGEAVQMRGGYYPIKYDSDRSAKAESHDAAQAAKDMMRGAYTRATTRRGHIEQRLEEVNRPVRKDLNVITAHLTEVIRDLSWHEWLIDANRLIGSEEIDTAIRTHYGPEVVKAFKSSLEGIATADVVPMTKIQESLLSLRGNITRATMGLSFTTALMQPLGLAQSVVRIGWVPVLKGAGRWAGDVARMESTVDWIHGKSEYMRLRFKTMNRELNEISGKLNGRSAYEQHRDTVLFFLTQKAQMVADVPTWVGAYEKAKLEHSEEKAIALADQAVLDSQGGGQTKDLAEVQRKHPFLTQFYSYFSTTLNLATERTAETDFKDPKAAAGWLSDMALLMVIPTVGTNMMLGALRGDGEDKEGWLVKQGKAVLGTALSLFVGARELSGMMDGFSYSGPPVAQAVTIVQKEAKQIGEGEIDDPLVLNTIRLLSLKFGLPASQMIRSYKGWKAWSDGEAPPTSILVGPPRK